MPIRQKRHYPASRLPLFLLTTSAFAVTAMPALAADTQDALPLSVSGDAATESSPAIVVTARRRTETAQDVPIALSVISSDALAATGNLTLGQTQQLVPSLQVFSYNPRNTNINIRGLGSNVSLTNDGLENGVGVYIDNVYYGRVGQSQFDLVDLSQIEVLRGPQGTLFGKNTTAGAINITSKPPSFDFEASGEATLGNYGYHQVRGSVSGPLIGDSVAARLSVSDTHRDGFIDNVLTGQKASDYDNFTVRGQLLVEPSDTVKIRLIGDYSKQTANCCVNLIAGVFPQYEDGTAISNNILERWDRLGYEPPSFDAFARKTDANSNFQANMEGYGLSGQIDWDLGGASLTSITAYRWWDWDPANDADATSLSVLTLAQQANRQRQFSQEVRLASRDSGAFDYVLGAYYFWQTVRGYGATGYGSAAPLWFLGASTPVTEAALSGYEVNSYSEPQTRTLAAFGQTDWHITPALTLTTGLRFTHEKKEGVYEQWVAEAAGISGFTTAQQAQIQAIRANFNKAVPRTYTAFSDNSLSGLVSLSWKVAPDVLAYASYARGNKSGGLNLTQLPSSITDATVRPETVDAFEAGLKSQFLDRRATFNAAGFWTEIRDYQTAITDVDPANPLVNRQYIANIPKVRSRGIEGELTFAASDAVSFNASGTYTDARYVSYANAPQAFERQNESPIQNLSGKRLPGVPRWSWTVGADFNHAVATLGGRDVSVYVHAGYAYRSNYNTSASNSAWAQVPGYGLANARIGLRTEDGIWDLSIWAKNLFDKDYFVALGAANTGAVTAQLGEPRTIGATLRTKL